MGLELNLYFKYKDLERQLYLANLFMCKEKAKDIMERMKLIAECNELSKLYHKKLARVNAR